MGWLRVGVVRYTPFAARSSRPSGGV